MQPPAQRDAPTGSDGAGEAEGAEGGIDPGTVLDCATAAHWQPLELKHLQTGSISTPVEGLSLPKISWSAGESQRLELGADQKVIALGQNGSKLRFAVATTCGDNTMITLHEPDGTGTSALLAEDIEVQHGVIGGDRLFLGTIARHRSEQATNGFVPREYLLTTREGKFAKVEPARNKSGSIPVAAASQIVQVRTGSSLCTTLFWKLGVGDCSFEGPNSEESVLVGSNMIFRDATTGKGMAWNAKDGPRELLSSLDWIITDGVNLSWSAGGKTLHNAA